MKTGLVSSLLGLFTATLLVVGEASAVSLQGDWAGEVHLQGAWQFATLHIIEERSPHEGTLQVLFTGQKLVLTNIHIDNATVTFTTSISGDSLSFSGVVRERFLEGTVRPATAGSLGDRFSFARLARIDLTKYTGAYEIGDDRVISISPVPDESMRALRPFMVQYTDTGTGRFGALFAVSETRFISGGPALRIFPTEIDISFSTNRDGQVSGLSWRDKDMPVARASKANLYQEEEVTFANDAVTLAGTLVTPKTRGQHPVVVFTHGSGPQLRQRGILEQLFVRAGFAVLTYDKRGVGPSAGKWQTSSFEDLADDAVAGARMLQTHRGIDRKRIGFWGLSQGAWIAPLAAARFGEAAFVIAASAGGLSPERQELLDTEYRLELAGFSPADIGEALAFQATRNSFMRTGNGWDAYKAMRHRVRSLKWYGYGEARGPASSTDPYWANQRRIYFYDPAMALEKLTCPVLFVFGALDTPRAVSENIAALQSSLAKAGNKDITLEVVPNAGHNLFLGETDSRKALTEQRLRYAPGYPQAFVTWSLNRTQPRGPR